MASDLTVTDLTGTKWYFNERFGTSVITGSYFIDFVSNDTTYFDLFGERYNGTQKLTYNNTVAFSIEKGNAGWKNESYRTISITGGTAVTNATLIAWLQANATQIVEPAGNPYLTFSSPNSFTLNVVDNIKYWDGTLEYSTDLSTWTVWDGTTTLSAQSDGTKYNLYIRGTGNTYITGQSASPTVAHWVLTGSNISCNGNIENLLDYQTVAVGNHPAMAEYCYSHMFYGCAPLTTAPELPATTLADYCYSSMFEDCSSLISAPELPATTLAIYCYYCMFEDCSSLISAPELPATTLASYCYAHMFQGCTSLITAPELPATTLANNCYQQMFMKCKSLVTSPSELPATAAAKHCCSKMFIGCTSLTTAPKLPATTLAASCYQEMFVGCSSLKEVPELPATKLVSSCYRNMFSGCHSIKLSETQTGNYKKAYRIPTTDTGTTAGNALTSMFSGTGGTFTGTPAINTKYYLWEENNAFSIGNLPIENMFFGTRQVIKVYYGNSLIWEKETQVPENALLAQDGKLFANGGGYLITTEVR